MTISYDPSESSSLLGLLRLLSRSDGIAKLVLGRSTFWLMLAVQFGFLSTRYLYANGYWNVPLPSIKFSTVSNVTSLLTFFIVFYGGSMYSRFQMFFGHCVGLTGCCMNWCALVRNHCTPDAGIRWNCTRLFLASFHVLFYSLNEPSVLSDGTKAPDIADDEWDLINSRQLLTWEEIRVLKAYKG